jgi:hypothetical protein
MTLSDPFMQAALQQIDSPDVIGVGLAGSYGHGQESQYSDVDFDIFVSKLPENVYDRYTLRYWDNKLIESAPCDLGRAWFVWDEDPTR